MAVERRIEPWPLAVAALLLAMVCASLAFLWIASAHPDAPVSEHPLAAAALAPGGGSASAGPGATGRPRAAE